MFNEFATAAATAGSWAQRPDLSETSRRLARIIASKASRLAESLCLDATELACFETIGCHLCWRVGEMRCEYAAPGTVACPLGMDRVKALEGVAKAA